MMTNITTINAEIAEHAEKLLKDSSANSAGSAFNVVMRLLALRYFVDVVPS